MSLPTAYTFETADAIKYGVDCAIVLHAIRFWLEKNKANDKHFYDGRYWTYNSKQAWADLFPFFSATQVRRILDKLVEKKVLVTGNYNSQKFDRTLWYAFADTGTLDEANLPNGRVESDSPIPDNIPNNIPDNKKEQTPKKEFLVLDTYDLGKYECLRPCLTEWVEYKATVHKDKYRAKYFGKTVKDLWDMSDGNVNIAQRMIDKAISCNWKGFHKLNKDEIPEDADIPDKPISAEEALERAKRLGLC